MAHILLVDDDPDVREMLRIMLTRAGHEVECAEDGSTIVQGAERLVVDLVITDILMPQVEGIETINHLAAARPDIPIIAMSGGDLRNRDQHLRIAELLGAKRVLAKPFTQEKLLQAIDDVLAGGESALSSAC